MRLLLDTHTAIWAISDSTRLPEYVLRMIADPSNESFVSAVSVLEIAIKRRLGRASAPQVSTTLALQTFAASDFAMLDVTATHAAALEDLPLLHGDPFDRLLVAQALTEPLRLLTHDRALARYSDTVIYFG